MMQLVAIVRWGVLKTLKTYAIIRKLWMIGQTGLVRFARSATIILAAIRLRLANWLSGHILQLRIHRSS